MCMECRQYPCDPRCPNAPEPELEPLECADCGVEISRGDVYHKLCGQIFCNDCVKHNQHIRGYE